jgi:MFS family permease
VAKKMPVHERQQPATRSAQIHPATYLFAARALRDFGDGFVAVLLPVYLLALGFTPIQVGLIATISLLGSALLTIGVGFLGARHDHRQLLLIGASLMTATGLAFAAVTDYGLLLVVAFAGTINPSAGSVSVFVPLEHAVLTREVTDAERTKMFARYSLVGTCAAAVGALAAATPDLLMPVGLDRLAGIKAIYLSFTHYWVCSVASFTLASRSAEQPVTRIQRALSAPHVTSSSNLRRCFASTPSPAASSCSHCSPFGFSSNSIFLFRRQAFFLLVGPALSNLFSDSCLAVAASRAHQYDGVHAHSIQHRPDAGGGCAHVPNGARLTADPGGTVANGRADALVLRHGGCHGGGARGGRKLHICSAQSRSRSQSSPRWRSLRCLAPGLAAADLRGLEDQL